MTRVDKFALVAAHGRGRIAEINDEGFSSLQNQSTNEHELKVDSCKDKGDRSSFIRVRRVNRVEIDYVSCVFCVFYCFINKFVYLLQ